MANAQQLPKSHHYHVYVVQLSDEVWNVARFRRCNPNYRLGQPFVYVGMTGLDPDVRFDKHMAGIQSNVFVRPEGETLSEMFVKKFVAVNGEFVYCDNQFDCVDKLLDLIEELLLVVQLATVCTVMAFVVMLKSIL